LCFKEIATENIFMEGIFGANIFMENIFCKKEVKQKRIMAQLKAEKEKLFIYCLCSSR
jgi:hypothetical protein